MRNKVRVVLQKVLLVAVGIACMLTVAPFFLAIIESLAFVKAEDEESIINKYVKNLQSKDVV